LVERIARFLEPGVKVQPVGATVHFVSPTWKISPQSASDRQVYRIGWTHRSLEQVDKREPPQFRIPALC
jgi:hypothetical protein